MPYRYKVLDGKDHIHNLSGPPSDGILKWANKPFVVDTRLAYEDTEPSLGFLTRLLPRRSVKVILWRYDSAMPLDLMAQPSIVIKETVDGKEVIKVVQGPGALPASVTPAALGARMYSPALKEMHGISGSPILLLITALLFSILGAGIAFLAGMMG